MNDRWTLAGVQLALAATVSVASPGSQAQDSAQPAGLEEVVVTAQRRESSLQTTPVAVSAFTESAIADLQIDQTEDVAAFVPNMVMTDGVNSPSTITVSLRGLGESGGGIATSESPVSFYIDDVYQARLSATNNQFADIERVEVLRGPQGQLFGRNSMTGSVNIISKTPGDEFYMLGEVSYGNYDIFAGKFAVGGPVVEGALAASVSVTVRDQGEGFATNIVTGEDIDAKDYSGARAKLHYYGNERLDAVWTVYYTDNENDGFVATAISKPELQPITGSYYRVQIANDIFGDSEQRGTYLHLTYDFDAFTFKSISAYSDISDDWRFDLGGGLEVGPGVFAAVFDRRSDIEQDQWTQEFQLFGNARDRRLDWIAGLYYFTEDSAQTFTDAFLGFPLPVTDYVIESESYAAYGQVEYAFSDRLSGIFGVRYTKDDKSITGSKAGPVNGSTSSSVWTPKIGIEYALSNGAFLYGSIGRGFKAGGFQGLAGSAATLSRPFDPEFLWAYEVGLKGDFLDQRMRFNIAAYFNEVSDLQSPIFDPNFPGNAVTENAIDMEYYGLELELTALLSDRLSLIALVGVQDERFTSIDPSAVIFGSGAERVQQVAHYNGAVAIQYEAPLANGRGSWFAGADFTFSDSLFSSSDNNAISESSNRARLNARVGYRSADERWSLALQARNLTDETDWLNGTDIGLPTQGIRQALDPRTYNLAFKFSY